jgi:protein-L-isoaspartate(D-aspartate) O-methyltransferase
MVERPVAPAGRPLSGARRRLVEELRRKGIRSTAVLAAIEATPRHLFLPTGVAHRAYEDAAIPIGSGQTISQPYVHARSLELLQLTGGERVLEIGTGSGYQTALLARLASQVYSVERVPELHERAAEVLQSLGVSNVTLACADGTDGWPANAPYGAIVVGAGAPDVPRPLVDQLAEHGRLVVPVGGREEQRLALIERRGVRLLRTDYDPVRFVPLLGTHGWVT